MFFGSLWLLREAVNALVTLNLSWPRKLTKPIITIALFLIVALCSLWMPVIIDGRLQVASPELLDTSSAPLRFGFRNITQAIYLVFGCTIAMLVALKNSEGKTLARSLQVYCWSGLFISCWGFLQWILHFLNLPYPAFVFNTSETISALGFAGQFGEVGLQRVSSVAVEPSLLAQFLLTIFPLLFFAVIGRARVISPFWDRIVLGIVITVLLLTTSATAYLGLLIVLLFSGILAYKQNLIRPIHILTLFVATAVCTIVYLSIPAVRDLFTLGILTKTESYSGLERIRSILLAWDYFLEYPILGIGWGSATSHDLVVKLLSNTGVLGLATFGIMLITVFGRLKLSVSKSPQEFWAGGGLGQLSIYVSLFILVSMNVLTGFAFVFGHFWFILGIAIGLPEALRTNPIAKSTNQAVAQ